VPVRSSGEAVVRVSLERARHQVLIAVGVATASKKQKALQAAAAAKLLHRMNREQDADTVVNIEKLQFKKGHHLNVFEVSAQAAWHV